MRHLRQYLGRSFHADVEEAPTLMIEAHADEIGFMIRHITKDGFLYVERVGGTDMPSHGGAACASWVPREK